jgi:hypothetical protein
MTPSTDWPELCPVKPVPHFIFNDEPSCHFCKAKNPRYPVSIDSTPCGKTKDEAIEISDSSSPLKSKALSTVRKEGYKSLGAEVAESHRQLSIQNIRQKEKAGYQNAGSAALSSRTAGVTSDRYNIQLTVLRGPYTIRNGDEVWDKSSTLVFTAIPLRDQKLENISLFSLLLEEMDDDDRAKLEGKDVVLARKYEPYKGPLKISNKQLQKFKTVGACLSALFPSKNKTHEITIVVREFQENEDLFLNESIEDLLTSVTIKGKGKGKGKGKASGLSSKQVKIKKEDAEKEIKKEVKKEIKREIKKEIKTEIKKEPESWKGWEETEELLRPSTPPTPGPATQTQKRPRSLSSPPQLPRPKAPVPPKTPERQGTSDDAIEVLVPMTDISEEEEEGEEEEEDQSPPARSTRAKVKGKGKAKKGGRK